MINKKDKIFLAGHNGLVGRAIFKKLNEKGYKNIVTIPRSSLDLIDQKKVFNFIKKKKPKVVIIAAAKVGGIAANNEFKAEFIYKNLSIQTNLIHSSHINGVQNLLMLGSSCVYPKKSSQPIKEEFLLSGYLEKTNEPYAIAKIAGIKMCESYNFQYKRNYKCLMPCNTFGPNDNYNLKTSHFLPALIRRIYEAKKNNKKSIKLWGTGKAKREVIYVDDIAEACIFFMNKKTNHSLINIGTEEEKTIKEYALFIAKKLKYNFKIKFENNKIMDGTPRKILNCKIAKSYGWNRKISFEDGIDMTIQNFINNYPKKYKKN